MFANTQVWMDLFLKFSAATILSGAIGLEREYHGRAAGLRTHILVCLASTAIMSISQAAQAVFESQGAESVFRIDPWRLAAGIVTGIGFLGGGAILKSNDLIRGLTTAACVWFVAAIGIIIGSGLYAPAIMITLFGLAVLTGLEPLGNRIPSEKFGRIEIVSEMASAEKIENACLNILRQYAISIVGTVISADSETGQRTLTLEIRTRKVKNKHEILKKLFYLPNVKSVRW
ncbi:putative magnesium transporter YhiD [Candidatus Desulfarcum epimagneticum]|uniref:Putative magnesium transporter YhiD n=1 Tax=uncultured Desulfobacteraceae bacterium TaxID=218296 RepID=A0A484HLU0_9BACT|nr:putative magnesium transporter YhiD [uncultured Desulfobacteraceae bacterium]